MIFTKKQNKYGTLLLEFLRFGIFTFGGGWSIIAQMQQLYVEKKKVITSQELLDLTSVAKSLPGTMIANVAMLYGYRVGGILGGLTSVFGMCFPPMAVLIAISFAYNAFRQNPWVHAAMSGMQAAVVPIILCAALGLAKGSVTYPPCLLVVLLKLYWSFLLIGFGSFGGLSMIPQISNQVLSNGWMTVNEVTDIVAIAEMTPGPLGLNCATFAGMQAAGIFGAVAANLGVLTPTLTLCALAAICFQKFKDSRIMQRILVGVRPACFGMVLGVLISLSMSNYISAGTLRLPSLAIGIVDSVLLLKYKISIPKILLLSCGAGLILFGVLHLA